MPPSVVVWLRSIMRTVGENYVAMTTPETSILQSTMRTLWIGKGVGIHLGARACSGWTARSPARCRSFPALEVGEFASLEQFRLHARFAERSRTLFVEACRDGLFRRPSAPLNSTVRSQDALCRGYFHSRQQHDCHFSKVVGVVHEPFASPGAAEVQVIVHTCFHPFNLPRVRTANDQGRFAFKARGRRSLTSTVPPQGSHSPRVWTIPNVICMARIAATPGMAAMVLLGHYDWAFCGLVAAGLSDGLDGYIARNYDQKSVLGSYLDPFSDKILINSLSLACCAPGVGLISAWVVAIIFVRDAGLIGSAVWIARQRTQERGEGLFAGTMKAGSPLEIKASPLSKVNTVLQLSMLTAAIGAATSFAPAGLADVVDPISYAAACTTAATVAEYILWPGYHQQKK